MFDIVLYQPEIPPNTGNLIRLAANTGCRLHLIEPLGFDLSATNRWRAPGWTITTWPAYGCMRTGRRCRRRYRVGAGLRSPPRAARVTPTSRFSPATCCVFGPESRGLPPDILATVRCDHRLRLPMLPGSRSMNLSNAVSVVVFEAWRQNGFAGGHNE